MASSHNIEYTIGIQADTEKAKQSINDLLKSLQKVSNTNLELGGEDNQIDAAASAAETLAENLAKATNVNTGKLDLTKFSKSLKDSGQSLQSLASNLVKGGTEGVQAFSKLTQVITATEVPVKKLDGALGKAMTTLTNTIKWEAASVLTHGIENVLSGAISYAKELNGSLSDIRIVTNKSIDDMARFTEQANKAAQSLSTTTSAYTKASLIYYQQGDDDSTVAKKAEITTKAANVAFSASSQEMSEYLTAVWNSYQVGEDELERYVDIMAALGATTATSTEEIATAMEKVASTANTVGVSMEQMSSIIATVSSVTRQSAETVGTAYKTILARISSLSQGETLDDGVTLTQYTQGLQKVGISVLDATGNLRDMGTVIEEIGGKWQTMNEAQKVALAQQIAGVRQYTQVMALFENWDQYQSNLETASNAEGTLDQQAEIYAEGWEGASKRSKAALEELYQKVIDDQAIIKVTNAFTTLIKFVSDLVDSFGGLKVILPTVLSIMASISSQKIASGLQKIGESVKGIFKEDNSYKKVFSDMREELQAVKAESDKISAAEAEKRNANNDRSGGYVRDENTAINSNIELLNLKEKLISRSRDLTDQQKAEANSAISYAAQLVNKLAEVEAKYKKISNEVKNAYEAIGRLSQDASVNYIMNEASETRQQKKDMENTLTNSKVTARSYKTDQSGKEQGEQLANIYAQARALQELSSKSKEMADGDYFNRIFSQNGNIQEKANAIDQLKQSFNQLYNSSNLSAEYRTQLDSLRSSLERLTTDSKAEDVKKVANDLKTAFDDIFKASKGDATVIKNYMDSVIKSLGDSSPELQEKMKAAWERLQEGAIQQGDVEALTALLKKQMQQAMDNASSKVDVSALLTKITQGFTGAARAVTSYLSVFNSIKSAYNAFNSASATTSEKISAVTTVVTGLGMAITAVQTMLKNFGLKAGWIGIVLTAIATIITWIAAATASAEELKQKALQASNETKKEKADSKVTELNEDTSSKKELIKAYAQLYETYKKTGEGEDELKAKAYELADAYGSLGAKVLIAGGNFEEANKLIKEALNIDTADQIVQYKTYLSDYGEILTSGQKEYYMDEDTTDGHISKAAATVSQSGLVAGGMSVADVDEQREYIDTVSTNFWETGVRGGSVFNLTGNGESFYNLIDYVGSMAEKYDLAEDTLPYFFEFLGNELGLSSQGYDLGTAIEKLSKDVNYKGDNLFVQAWSEGITTSQELIEFMQKNGYDYNDLTSSIDNLIAYGTSNAYASLYDLNSSNDSNYYSHNEVNTMASSASVATAMALRHNSNLGSPTEGLTDTQLRTYNLIDSALSEDFDSSGTLIWDDVTDADEKLDRYERYKTRAAETTKLINELELELDNMTEGTAEYDALEYRIDSLRQIEAAYNVIVDDDNISEIGDQAVAVRKQISSLQTLNAATSTLYGMNEATDTFSDFVTARDYVDQELQKNAGEIEDLAKYVESDGNGGWKLKQGYSEKEYKAARDDLIDAVIDDYTSLDDYAQIYKTLYSYFGKSTNWNDIITKINNLDIRDFEDLTIELISALELYDNAIINSMTTRKSEIEDLINTIVAATNEYNESEEARTEYDTLVSEEGLPTDGSRSDYYDFFSAYATLNENGEWVLPNGKTIKEFNLLSSSDQDAMMKSIIAESHENAIAETKEAVAMGEKELADIKEINTDYYGSDYKDQTSDYYLADQLYSDSEWQGISGLYTIDDSSGDINWIDPELWTPAQQKTYASLRDKDIRASIKTEADLWKHLYGGDTNKTLEEVKIYHSQMQAEKSVEDKLREEQLNLASLESEKPYTTANYEYTLTRMDTLSKISSGGYDLTKQEDRETVAKALGMESEADLFGHTEEQIARWAADKEKALLENIEYVDLSDNNWLQKDKDAWINAASGKREETDYGKFLTWAKAQGINVQKLSKEEESRQYARYLNTQGRTIVDDQFEGLIEEELAADTQANISYLNQDDISLINSYSSALSTLESEFDSLDENGYLSEAGQKALFKLGIDPDTINSTEQLQVAMNGLISQAEEAYERIYESYKEEYEFWTSEGELIAKTTEEYTAMGAVAQKAYDEALAAEQQINSLRNSRAKAYGFDSEDDWEAEAQILAETKAGKDGYTDEAYDENVEGWKRVAKANKSFQKGMDTTNSKYETWVELLEDGVDETEEEIQAVQQLKEVFAQILGVDSSLIDIQFILDNLTLLGEILNGDTDAWSQLVANFNQEIPTLNGYNLIEDQITSLGSLIENFSGLNAGDVLALGPEFYAGLAKAYGTLINNGWAVEDAVAFINSTLGSLYQVDLSGITVSTDSVDVTGIGSQDIDGITAYDLGEQGVVYDVKTHLEQGDTQTVTFPQLTLGGNTVVTKKDTNKHYTGGSSSSSGGSSSKKTKKEKIKYSKNTERYHEITNVLDEIGKKLTTIDKLEERAFGPAKVKLIEQETKALQNQLEAYEEKMSEVEEYLYNDQIELDKVASDLGIGISYNEDGDIENYVELMQAWTDEWNKAIEEYNNSKKNNADSILETAQDKLDDYKEIIEQYEKTVDEKLTAYNNILETLNKIYTNNLESITYEVQYKLDLDQNDRDLLEYFANKWQDDLDEQSKLMQNYISTAASYLSDLYTISDGVTDLVSQYKQYLADQSSGIDAAAYVEGLTDFNSKIQDALASLQDEQDKIEQTYENTLKLSREEIDEQTEKIKSANTQLEKYVELLGLMGEGKKYNEVNEYLQANYNVLKSNVSGVASYLSTLEAARTKFVESVSGDLSSDWAKEQYEALTSEINATNEELLEAVKAALDEVTEIYQNKIEQIFDTLDKQMADKIKEEYGYSSFSDLSEDYSYYTEDNDRYLSDAKKLYEVSKLGLDIDTSINKATNSQLKSELAQLKASNNEKAKSNKYTEYDAEMYELQYEYLLKKYELEEAQNAKNTVQLTRDDNGNYIYRYTSDENEVAEKQQEYEDILQQINDLAVSRQSELENSYLQNYQSYVDKAEEIANDEVLTQEEKTTKLKELAERYYDSLEYYAEQYGEVLDHLKENEDRIKEVYNVDKLTNNIDNFSTKMHSGLLTLIQDTGSAETAFSSLIGGIESALKDQQTQTDEALAAGKLSTIDQLDKMEETTEKLKYVAESAKNEIGLTNDELTNQATAINAAAQKWIEYNAQLSNAITYYEQLSEKITNVIKALTNSTVSSFAYNATSVLDYLTVPTYSNQESGNKESESTTTDYNQLQIADSSSIVKIIQELSGGSSYLESLQKYVDDYNDLVQDHNNGKLTDSEFETQAAALQKTYEAIEEQGKKYLESTAISSSQIDLSKYLTSSLDEFKDKLKEVLNACTFDGLIANLPKIELSQNVEITAQFPNIDQTDTVVAALNRIIQMAGERSTVAAGTNNQHNYEGDGSSWSFECCG